jgi:hypothetical protein
MSKFLTLLIAEALVEAVAKEEEAAFQILKEAVPWAEVAGTVVGLKLCSLSPPR